MISRSDLLQQIPLVSKSPSGTYRWPQPKPSAPAVGEDVFSDPPTICLAAGLFPPSLLFRFSIFLPVLRAHCFTVPDTQPPHVIKQRKLFSSLLILVKRGEIPVHGRLSRLPRFKPSSSLGDKNLRKLFISAYVAKLPILCHPTGSLLQKTTCVWGGQPSNYGTTSAKHFPDHIFARTWIDLFSPLAWRRARHGGRIKG